MTKRKGIRLMQGLSGSNSPDSVTISLETLRRLVIAGNYLHQAFQETGGEGAFSRAEFDLWEAALDRLRSEVKISGN